MKRLIDTGAVSVIIRKLATEFIAVQNSHNYQMSDRQARKDLSKQLANYKPSPYSRTFSLYQRRTLAKVDPILRAIALPSPLAARFPVYKILRAVAKMLLLNEMELVIMSILIEQSRWSIQDAAIIENETGVGELLCFPCENSDYRRLTLYILLVGWGAKNALNDSCEDILDEVRRVCLNFKSIFQQWVYPYAGVLNLHPAALNRLYSYYLNPLASAKTDYQLMVDTILQLSQAYNSEKDAIRTIPLRPSHAPSPHKLAERPATSGLRARFTHVGLEAMEKIEEKKEEEEEMNVFGNKDLTQSIRFPGIFGSSMGGMFGMGSMNISKKSDFQYFQIELGQGDNNFMVFSQADPTLSSMLGIQRVISSTDQFLQRQEEGRSEY